MAIVSLTITEKGYCIDPATGSLDLSNPRIAHDLQTPTEPHSVPELLLKRYTAGVNAGYSRLPSSLAIISRTMVMW